MRERTNGDEERESRQVGKEKRKVWEDFFMRDLKNLFSWERNKQRRNMPTIKSVPEFIPGCKRNRLYKK